MNKVNTNWAWYNYCGFLALVLASLFSNSFVLYAITDKEASDNEYYTGLFLFSVSILLIIMMWRKGKADALAAFIIGAAPPSVAALFIWFIGL